MIKAAILFLATGVALVVAVTAAIGLAWLAIAIPVLISSAAGYGLLALSRQWSARRANARPAKPHEGRAERSRAGVTRS